MITPSQEAIARKAAEETLESLHSLANYDDLKNRNTSIILAAIEEGNNEIACPLCGHGHLGYLDDEPCVSCGCEGKFKGDKSRAAQPQEPLGFHEF
jgi:rubrerythrin